MILQVKITPNAHKNVIEGLVEGRLKIRIKAEPDKGKANAELIKFLSKALSIPKKNITISSGLSSRLKTLSLTGVNREDLDKLLLDLS
jgi:uncharacterized protein